MEEIKELVFDTAFESLQDLAIELACYDVYPFGDYLKDPDNFINNVKKEARQLLDKLLK